MSSDLYGQSGKDHHVRQWILARLNKNDEHFPLPEPSTSRSPTWQEQRYLSQDSPLSYQDVSQHQDDQISHMHSKSNQTLRQEDKMALTYSNQAAFHMPQGHRSPSSPGLDGQSLYCTEILPSASPPSQPVAVEGGGTSRRSLVAVNGGVNSQPVQYTIIITDPQLHQASNSNNNASTTSGATSILLNTLVQQQQQQQHLQLQQQQLQHHLATISKGNSNINNLITGAANTNIIVNNNNNINGSSKLGSLLICSNSNSSFTGESGVVSSTSTFPATFITNSQNSPFSDGKNIHLAKVTLSANNKLPATVLDSGSIEGGIVILNYTDPLITPGSSITNINQLVSVHGKVPNTINLNTQGTAQLLTNAVSNNNTVVSANRSVVASSKISLSDSSDLSQIDFRTRTSSGNSVAFNGQTFVCKDDSGELTSSENSGSHISQQLSYSPEQQLLESTSSADRVCGGMHSGRSGSGQAHSNLSHSQQQQHNPASSNSSPSASATTASQSTMLSAGQPSGIFRTGTDNTTSSQRLSVSGSTSYVPTQHPSIYGIHSQTTGHLSTLQPYSTFFPGFGGSGTSRHSFPHGSVMTGASQAHYPHIESYSAMLASMGSHVQHRGAQGAERAPIVSAPGVSVTQHTSPFLSSAAHLAAPGIQYVGIPTTSHQRSSGSSSPSPGPAATTHASSSASTHLEPLLSHHLEKVTTVKGGSSLQSREGELSRERIIYGDTSNLHDDKTGAAGTYSAGSHIPKVSFDSVVKEYGGGRDSPTGRSDIYFRTSLSGKEGSLKHRILTRPSESEIMDAHTKVSGVHGLKDEPLSKRPKITHVGGSASTTYSAKATQGHQSDSQRSNNRYHTVSHTSHYPQPDNNNVMEGRGISARHTNDNVSLHEVQQPSLYQHCPSEDNSSDIRYEQTHYYSSPNSAASPASLSSDSAPSHIQYPTHFMKGSIIQLANGTLKRVEDLQTEDFVNSAEISSDLKVDSSTVVRIEEQPDRGTAMLSFSVGEHRVQVTVEATLEHPFFVFGQGWSSCSVSRTLARYGLDCQKLNVGDVCISLTHKDVNLKAAEIGQQQQEQNYLSDNKLNMTGSSSGEHQIPQSTSSLTLTPSSSADPSSALASHIKSENTVPSSQSSSTSVDKRQLSQTELPPPLSNIVLVKKENNGHNSQRKGSQRVEEELMEDKAFEEDDQSESTMSLRKRRWSAPDTGCVKTDPDRERERQLLVSGAQKADETFQTSKTDNGQQ